jgi:TPR repeat protein
LVVSLDPNQSHKSGIALLVAERSPENELGVATMMRKLTVLCAVVVLFNITNASAQDVTAIRNAAEQGNAAAQFNLGELYLNGDGVSRDDTQAVAWFRKAAEQGNAPAQFNLGMMYANGRGVPRDDVQAVVWFRKAAEQGLDAARSELESKKAQDRGSSVIGLPPWVQSYSDSNKSCRSWTDDCVTCKRDAGAELACSNIGVACQPKDVRCLDSIKTTAPK